MQSISHTHLEISFRHDISTQVLGDAESKALFEQEQKFLQDLYERGAQITCKCVSPPVGMHIKSRDGQRFWLANNPHSPEHDIECALYTHKLTPLTRDDPYYIGAKAAFRLVSNWRVATNRRCNTHDARAVVADCS